MKHKILLRIGMALLLGSAAWGGHWAYKISSAELIPSAQYSEYAGNYEAVLGGRTFILPYNYTGLFYKEKPKPNLHQNYNHYLVIASYPEFGPGYPKFEDGKIFELGKLNIHFFLSGDENDERGSKWNTQNDLSRLAESLKGKIMVKNSEPIKLDGLGGLKTNRSYYLASQDNSSVITCEIHWPVDNPKIEPDRCQHHFIDENKGLAFQVDYYSDHLKDWQNIEVKTKALIAGFEKTY